LEPPPELALAGDRPPTTLADRVENAASVVLLVGMAEKEDREAPEGDEERRAENHRQ
jgi:hypothetical protein